MLKSLRRTNSGIGLEIGDRAIKLAHLRSTSGLPEVLQTAWEPISESESGEASFKQTLAAFREIVKRTGLRKKTVAVALNPAILTIRDVQIPRVPDEELFSVIEWETRQLIEFSQETHNLDFIIHNREDEGLSNKYQAMVVVSRKKDLEDTVKLVEGAGLRVRRLGIPADALCSLASIHPDLQQNMGLAIVNIGHHDSSVTVVHAGKLRFTRQLDFSLNTLIGEIAEQMAVSAEDAAAVIQQTTLSQSDTETLEMKQQRTLVGSILESLMVELNRSFNFYSSVSRGGAVSRVYITGDLTSVQGVEPFFLEHLGVITNILHPFKGLQVPGRIPAHSNQFSVAIGMGLML